MGDDLVRTQEEILAELEVSKERDPFGLAIADLLSRLTFEKAEPLLKPEFVAKVRAGEEKWETLPLDRESILKEMREYMEFAWDKATGHRGLSAGRSINHFQNWTWLIGDKEAFDFISADENYAPYSAPSLVYLCKRYGFPMPDVDAIARIGGGE